MPPNDDGAKALSPTSDPNLLSVFGLNQAEELLVTADIACVLRRLPDLIPWFVNLNLAEEKKGHCVGCKVIARPFTADNAASCDPQSLVAARSTILTGCFHELTSSTAESKQAFLAVLKDADDCVAQEVADELNPDELRGLLQTVAAWNLTDKDTQKEAAAAIGVINKLVNMMPADKCHDVFSQEIVDALHAILWANNKKNPRNDPPKGCPHDDMVAAALELFMSLCEKLGEDRHCEFKKLFTRIFTLSYIEAAQKKTTKRQKAAFRALCLLDQVIAKALRSVSGPDDTALFLSGQDGADLIKSINEFRTPEGASPVEVYIIGHCGTGKSSFIRTLMWLLLNDKTAKWHLGTPTVSSKPKKSVTTGLHRFEDQFKGEFVLYDSKGIEQAGMDKIQSVLKRLADGMVPVGHDTVEWNLTPPQPSFGARMWKAMFPPKPTTPDELVRPQAVLLFINATANNIEINDYRRMIQTVRDRGVLVQVVITKSAEKAATEAANVKSLAETALLREPRCLGEEQDHQDCTNCAMDQTTGHAAVHTCNRPPQQVRFCTTCKDTPANLTHRDCCDANLCEEMYWRERLGEPGHVYIIEPFREGPNARQKDFFDLGVHNAIEILSCMDRVLYDAGELVKERLHRAKQLGTQ